MIVIPLRLLDAPQGFRWVLVGLECVTEAVFIEKNAAFGRGSGTQREFAMKASVCSMKTLRIETARCELPYASFPAPHAAHRNDYQPLNIQPLGCLS